jgi:hypothetical protein
MYFKEFPKFYYDFKGNDGKTELRLVRDITRNVRFRKELLANVSVFDYYDIKDGETPEIIAEKVYGNPEYHWIIMLANERFNYAYEFPLEETALARVIQAKFNEDFTITSWSYSGTTVTATLVNHGLLASPTTQVKFSGATATTNAPNDVWYNVTSVTDDTFTFEVGTAPTGTAGGTVTVSTQGREKYPAHWVSDSIPGHEGHGHWYKVDSDFPGAVAVTCEQMERDENEAKRRIKLISKEAIAAILKNYRDLI